MSISSIKTMDWNLARRSLTFSCGGISKNGIFTSKYHCIGKNASLASKNVLSSKFSNPNLCSRTPESGDWISLLKENLYQRYAGTRYFTLQLLPMKTSKNIFYEHDKKIKKEKQEREKALIKERETKKLNMIPFVTVPVLVAFFLFVIGTSLIIIGIFRNKK